MHPEEFPHSAAVHDYAERNGLDALCFQPTLGKGIGVVFLTSSNTSF
jgi:hypothetical protein